MVISGAEVLDQMVKDVANRKDQSFKLLVYPKQFFLGNHEMRLKKDAEYLVFNFNAKRRMQCRIVVETESLNRKISKDIGLGLVQIEQMSIKEGDNESNPPVLVMHITDYGSAKLIEHLGGTVETHLIERKPKNEKLDWVKKQLIFVLRDDPVIVENKKSEDIYARFSFGDGDYKKTFEFDNDKLFDVLKNPLTILWKTVHVDKFARKSFVRENKTANSIEKFIDSEFELFMDRLNLHRKNMDGEAKYLYFTYNLQGSYSYMRHIPNRNLQSNDLSDRKTNGISHGLRRTSSDEDKLKKVEKDGDRQNAIQLIKKTNDYRILSPNDRDVSIRAKRKFLEMRRPKDLDFGSSLKREKRARVEEKEEIADTAYEPENDENKSQKDIQGTIQNPGRNDSTEVLELIETWNEKTIIEENERLTMKVEERKTVVYEVTQSSEEQRTEVSHFSLLTESIGKRFLSSGPQQRGLTDDLDVMNMNKPDLRNQNEIAKDEISDETTPKIEQRKEELTENWSFNQTGNDYPTVRYQDQNETMKVGIKDFLKSNDMKDETLNSRGDMEHFVITDEQDIQLKMKKNNVENIVKSGSGGKINNAENYHDIRSQELLDAIEQGELIQHNTETFNDSFMFMGGYQQQFPSYNNYASMDSTNLSVSYSEYSNDMHNYDVPTTSNVSITYPTAYQSVTNISEAYSLQNQRDAFCQEGVVTKKPRLEEGGRLIYRDKKIVVSLSDDEQEKSISTNKKPNEIPDIVDKDGRIINNDTQLFSFPPKGMVLENAESVVVCIRDVKTLERHEFVNDVIISFKIGYTMAYQIDIELRKRIHFFNTFFYSGLLKDIHIDAFTPKATRRMNATATPILSRNIERITKWTKRFDVFEKECIVIPINEEYHWMLIAVINPSGALIETENEEESRKKPKTYVVFMDPLSGLDITKRQRMCTCVKEYLIGLYQKTKTLGGKFVPEKPTILDPERIIITRPKNTPIQKNFYDCGLYVLHYIETLFCSLKPISVQDFPDLDWSERFERGEDMADLMRDKCYNLVQKFSKPEGRSRLERYERMTMHGLSLEGSRKNRRHSAGLPRNQKRNVHHYPRHFSLSPPEEKLQDEKSFNNPRSNARMPISEKVRSIRPFEPRFPTIY